MPWSLLIPPVGVTSSGATRTGNLAWRAKFQAAFDVIAPNLAVVLNATGCRELWLHGELYRHLGVEDADFSSERVLHGTKEDGGSTWIQARADDLVRASRSPTPIGGSPRTVTYEVGGTLVRDPGTLAIQLFGGQQRFEQERARVSADRATASEAPSCTLR